MVKAGSWGEDAAQLHRFFGWKKIIVAGGAPFSVLASDCYLDETNTHGRVYVSKEEACEHPEYMSDSGEMSWNLKIDKKSRLTSDTEPENCSVPCRHLKCSGMRKE